MFENFPYSNFHDLNTDWLVKKVKDVEISEANAKASEEASAESASASALSADNAHASELNAQASATASAQSATASANSATEANNYVASTRAQVNLLQSRVDNIIPSGTQTEGNTELLDIRVAYNGVRYPSAGDAVRAQVGDLKNALNQDALYGNLLVYGTTSYGKAIDPRDGLETSNADFNTTDFIPVSEGELLYSNIITRCAFYDSEKALVSTFNFSSKQLLFSEVSDVRYAVVPTGAVYFKICYRKNLANSCFLCRPNVYDVVYGQKIDKMLLHTKTNFWDYGTVLDNTRIHASTGATISDVNYKTTDFISVTPGTAVYGYGERFYCYDENKTAISGATDVLNTYGEALSNGMHYYKIPEGAAFFRICENKTTNQFQIYNTDIFETILHEAESVNTRKLYTLGDSITRGMYAEQGATSSSGPTPHGYPYWIGQITGYEVVNLGNSGSGWANVGSAETEGDPSTARNAKDVVDDNTFADADIITMAWGVNDWKGASQDVHLGSMASVSGDGSVIGNMKYCIETLVTKNPTAQLIVLLPMNTNRKWSGMRDMTLEENWAFGYPYRNNQTLQDYRNAIRECAEYYNVKVVDLEEICPINRLNIRSVCGDGLHPTLAFHKQMGLALAPLIR